MARKSSIQDLPDPVKSAVDAAIREGRATIDDIVATVRAMGADASRSAVGRYKQSHEKALVSYRRAQDAAAMWLKEFGDNPRGDVGLLVAEMVKTKAFETMADLAEGGDAVEMSDMALLAKTMKDLESAKKSNVEARAKIRAEIRAEQVEKLKAAEAEIARVQKGGGLAATDAAALRAALLDAMA